MNCLNNKLYISRKVKGQAGGATPRSAQRSHTRQILRGVALFSDQLLNNGKGLLVKETVLIHSFPIPADHKR